LHVSRLTNALSILFPPGKIHAKTTKRSLKFIHLLLGLFYNLRSSQIFFAFLIFT